MKGLCYMYLHALVCTFLYYALSLLLHYTCLYFYVASLMSWAHFAPRETKKVILILIVWIFNKQ